MENVSTLDETTILRRLSAVGYEYESLAALRTSGRRYRDAIPTLLCALASTNDIKLKIEIVRALSVPWAKPSATGPLVEEFRRATDEKDLRWIIGNALEVVWDDDHFSELVEIATDRRLGRAREMVVLGFRRSKRAEAGDVLIGLLDDPTVNGHAASALRRLKLPRARTYLEPLLTDKRAWVRKEAERALAALG